MGIHVKRLTLLKIRNMAFEIRPVTEVTEPLQEAFDRLLPQLSPRLEIPTREMLRRVVASSSAVLFAVWNDGRIDGVLALGWYDTATGRKAWIEDVVVDAVMRGSGAGEALVRAAMEHAERIGAEKVSLTSNVVRTAARALYRKVGFEEADTTVFVCKIERK